MDTYDFPFLADPRNLTMAERLAARDKLREQQVQWLDKLERLSEGWVRSDDFPAFLLATEPFVQLAHRLHKAGVRRDLPPEVADELDWFLDAFADYLRTSEGEDVFEESPRLTG